MNQKELKKVLKPLIKECVKEMIFEDGILSNIISETIRGLSTSSPIVENKKEKQNVSIPRVQKKDNLREIQARFKQEMMEETEQERNSFLQEQRKKLSVVAANGVNVFEGLEPIEEGKVRSSSSSPSPGKNSAPSLSNWDPNDSGVDISNLVKRGGYGQ